MKIVIELPRKDGQPSQGRNPGSIPGGSTTAQGFEAIGLIPSMFYRARIEVPETLAEKVANPDEPDEIFVFFVGWDGSEDRAVFERGDGDFFIYDADRIEVSS